MSPLIASAGPSTSLARGPGSSSSSACSPHLEISLATHKVVFARTASSAHLQLFPLLKEKTMKTLKVILLMAVLALGVAGGANAAQAGCCSSADC